MNKMKEIVCSSILFSTIAVFAQAYEATIEQSMAGNILNVDLKLRTTGGTSDLLGDATFTIDYNSSVLTYIGKDANFDGRWDNDNSSDYNDLDPGNFSTRASLSVIKGSETGLDIPTSATQIGRIQFNIIDTNANSGIKWNSLFQSVKDYSGNDIKNKLTYSDPADFSLPVQLVSFTAQENAAGVELAWMTESEVDNLGFNIWKSELENANYEKLNRELIGGAGNSTSSHEYKFIDNQVESGKTYYYKLEDVDTLGRMHFYPAIAVEVNLPNIQLEWKPGANSCQ